MSGSPTSFYTGPPKIRVIIGEDVRKWMSDMGSYLFIIRKMFDDHPDFVAIEPKYIVL